MSSAHLKKFEQIKPAIIEWRDQQPFNPEFGDIYFSSQNPIEESDYVFAQGCQLLESWQQKTNTDEQQTFHLAELGFGTGLNFLVTAKLWQAHLDSLKETTRKPHLHFVSIEKRPIAQNDLQEIYKLWPELKDISDQLIDKLPSPTYGRHQIEFSELNITLTLFYMPVEQALDDLLAESGHKENKIKFEHWFLDGFSPSKNQDMWCQEMIDKIAKLSRTGSLLATFSVSSQVKNALMTSGFVLNKRKGFEKKREVLSAKFVEKKIIKQQQYINLKYDTPWFNSSSSSSDPISSGAIIGAGLAGCATAYALSKKGIQADLYESGDSIASGASGAAAGIFHPQLTPDMNLPSQFSWLAYLYLLRFLSELNDNQKDTLFYGKGLIKGLSTPEDQERLAIKDWIHSLSSGVSHNEFKAPHLYFPHAGALNIPQFCQLLIELAGLSDERLFLSTQVNSIEKNGEQWQLLFKQDGENQSKNYQHIILCTGSAFQKPMTNHFDSKTYATHLTRGQSCIINHDDSIPLLKQVLMDQVYLVPQNNGQLHIGATFEPCEQPDSFDLDPLVQRQLLEQANSTLKKFGNDEIADELIKSLTINGNVGYRLHTQDKLPLVGGLIDEIKLKKDFANLGQRKIRNEDLSTYNLPGLWMNSAYGSHGLLYALIASEHLSNTITSGISPINSQLAQAIHPVRFLIKQLLKTGTT